MIITVYGTLFTSPAHVLVNPVNTHGSMASGLSQKFKAIFPPMFEHYSALCESDSFNIGQLLLYRNAEKWVLNFPIKRHPNAKATLETIETGLLKFVSIYADLHVGSVSFPALGVGEGLTHDEVLPLLEGYLRPLPITAYLHINDDPFAVPLRADTLAKRLNGQLEHVTFEAFWRNIVALARKTPHMMTYDNPQKMFQVATREEGHRRLSLSLTPEGDETHFLPQSVLRDLWQYVRTTVYSLPQNLPSGLDQIGACVVSLLAKLESFRPIYLQADGGQKVVGLHYVPPVGKPHVRRETLTT
jgi:hypothetical protein